MILQKCCHIVRNLHRSCPQLARKKLTPGISHQLKAFEDSTEILEDPESFGDLESDFMGVGKTHRQHEAEIMKQREKIRQIMVKNKYFPEQKLPNLLLYAEKEEIRTLHDRNPEEWTTERLAESFPATPQIVKKIINTKWRPYSEKRIRLHDEAVICNWERFKNNKENSEIPPELQEHLSKFAARTLKQTASEEYIKAVIPKLPIPKHNEFTTIITSCKKYADNTEADQRKDQTKKTSAGIVPHSEEEDTYLLEKVVDKRYMRLQELKKFKSIDDSLKPEGEQEQSTIKATPDNPSGTGFIEKFESNEISIGADDSKRYEMLPFKDRIHIPRKLWHKGKTYRVKDSYYDDDGEFLFRVPGMSNQDELTKAKSSKK